jgi:hypothetical protein
VKCPELENSYIINTAAAMARPPSTANSPCLWRALPVDDFALVVEVVELVAMVGLVEDVEGVARELLVAAMKGPKTPPCCCAGVVVFKVLAALVLKMARDSDVLEL